mgnify:CR=1 FL=1
MVKDINTIAEWKQVLAKLRAAGQTIGFVPTMGALHRGHRSLVEQSVSENDVTVVSIFVNPTQFNDPNDLKNYPMTLEADRSLLEASKADYIYLPERQQLYPKDYRYKVIETELSQRFCGAHRPGHFDGVLSVVMKLLNIIEADRSYFGEKDWQQYLLIKGMAEAFFLNTAIIPCPLIREADGLAYSSRNKLLTAEQRKLAPEFHEVLNSGISINEMRTILESKGFEVDYIEMDSENNRILGAVILGKVRLIDNVKR